jgi:hypothetical protein
MEALVVPVMVFNFMVALPMEWVFRKGTLASRWAGVSGQFILARRKAYRAFGGHEAVQNEIVEDLRLGRRAVAAGFRVTLADGTDVSAARMYTRASEVWEGFTKNIFPAVEFSIPQFILLQAGLLFNGVAPFLVTAGLFAGWLPWEPRTIAALVFSGVQVFIRAAHAYENGFAPLSVSFHPLGVLLFTMIGFNSMRVYVFGEGGVWKGRRLSSSEL